MVALLTSKPEAGKPFLSYDIYPHFALFAAFYSQATDGEKQLVLYKVAQGEPLHNVVNANDRAFLFFVYVTICAHLDQPTGWYFSTTASKTLRHIKRWMEAEDEDKEANKAAAELTKTIGAPLEMVLTRTSTAGTGDADQDSEDSDDLDE